MTLKDRSVGRALDGLRGSREPDLVSELFHRINRVIPENQRLLAIPPDMPVRQAVALLREHNYSQLPVVVGNEVLGVFSHRSFAQKLAGSTWSDLSQSKCAPGDWPVEECLEQFRYARVTEEMVQVFDAMDRDNGVLIGTPENLLGILTPMDFLHYLYNVTSPFVMISEIELTLRALIRLAVSLEQLEECASRSLVRAYGSIEKVPKTLDKMTFDNYVCIVGNPEDWPKFGPVLGANRIMTVAKLRRIGTLRNDLFHFRRQITVQDHQTLSDLRNWILVQATKANQHRIAGGQR